MPNKSPLTSVSVSYSPAQDRLLFKATDTQGAVVHLWMTQRLMRLVRPHVEVWLEKTTQEIEETKPTSQDKPAKGASKPVAQKQAKPQHELLVANIDLSSGGEHMQFTFRGAEAADNQYVLRLGAEQLNKWWSGVMQTCDLGAWSTDKTPEPM